MQQTRANDLLYTVLREMTRQNDFGKRQSLQGLGESLLGEYTDLNSEEVLKRIRAYSSDPTSPSLAKRSM